MKILALFLLGFIGEARSTCEQMRTVNTHSGPIQGNTKYVQNIPVQAFLGIPYAEPPLGNQRFLKPKPVKSWTKTLKATQLPPACMQYTIYPFPWYDDQPGKSEDCLYLNIYAPNNAKNGSNFAVLFWIHGGGYLHGSSRMELYDASSTALFGNLIVVTFNYRLNVFGFLTSNTEDAPGNVALYDMLMALQWVNNNIKLFGGDKNRITLAGESVGSLSVSIFCVSPLAKGLFTKAIMESGSILVLPANQLQSNLNVSQTVAVAAGCASGTRTIENDPEAVISCLRNQNAGGLAYLLWSLYPTASLLFWPQLGDDLFPINALDDIRNGNSHNVSLLIGANQDEGAFFITTTDPDIFGFFGEKDTYINKAFGNQLILNILNSYSNPEKYAEYYLDSVPDNDYVTIRRQAFTAAGDAILLCPTVYFAEKYAEKYENVYFYYFVHRPSITPWASWIGVAHFEEVQFVFGRPIRDPDLYDSNEIELSKKMIATWTNFAKSGFPSYSFNWPKYTKEKHEIGYIKAPFNADHFGIGPHLDNCEILRDHFGF